MSTRSIGWKCGILALVMFGTVAARQDPEGDPDAPDVLTRGPIHEAYAEPVVFDPTPGVVVPKPPPDPIEEQPPDQMPEGADVQWISGYWSWDDERGDFIWISGIWRNIPPGRQWYPGYWSEVEGGFQWTSGFWAPVEQEEVEYLPTPPQTLEVGPNTPAPSAEPRLDARLLVLARGALRLAARLLDRVPAELGLDPRRPTSPRPAAASSCAGYWDYTLANRGLLFAPVYFQPVVYAQPAFVYTPTVTINSTVLTDHFFCRPSYRHYYFGDYYAAGSARGSSRGSRSSRAGTWYDPIYAHTRVVNVRRDPGWDVRVRETYRYRTVHVDARPARTFVAQQALFARRQDADVRQFALARTLAQAGRDDNGRVRLERVDRARQAELGQRQQALQQLRERRTRLEAQTQAQREDARERLIVRKQEMPKSPIAARGPRARPGSVRLSGTIGPVGPPTPRATDRTRSPASGPPGSGPAGHPQKQARPERTKAQGGTARASARPGPPQGSAEARASPGPAQGRTTEGPAGPRHDPAGFGPPQGATEARSSPRDLPKAERTKAQANPQPFRRPEAERPQPKRERPADRPKAQPFRQPGLDLPPAQPRPQPPRTQPAPRPPAEARTPPAAAQA